MICETCLPVYPIWCLLIAIPSLFHDFGTRAPPLDRRSPSWCLGRRERRATKQSPWTRGRWSLLSLPTMPQCFRWVLGNSWNWKCCHKAGLKALERKGGLTWFNMVLRKAFRSRSRVVWNWEGRQSSCVTELGHCQREMGSQNQGSGRV